jgi:hypothetical protein
MTKWVAASLGIVVAALIWSEQRSTLAYSLGVLTIMVGMFPLSKATWMRTHSVPPLRYWVAGGLWVLLSGALMALWRMVGPRV